MKKLIPVIAVLGLFMAANQARAVAPDLIPIQGVLTDAADLPVDGTVTAVFSLYTTETGGTALYTETQSVLVEDGLFTAYVGDVTALDLTIFRDNDDLWLGIQIDSDAEMSRVYLGSVPFAGYAEWCGNHPTPDFADITGTLDVADLPTGVVVGALACTDTDKVSGIDSSGALVCSADVDTDTDTDTTYTAGTGLTLTGTTFSADTSVLQARVGACSTGQYIQAIAADGTPTCVADVDTDTDTTYTAGRGLDLTGTQFLVDPTDFNSANPINQYWTTASFTHTGAAYGNLGSLSFTPPVNGHILVTGMADVYCSAGCSTGSTQTTYLYVSTSSTSSTGAYSRIGWLPADGTGSLNLKHMSTQYEWAVTGGTAYTFYMLADLGTSTATYVYIRRNLSYVFIPD